MTKDEVLRALHPDDTGTRASIEQMNDAQFALFMSMAGEMIKNAIAQSDTAQFRVSTGFTLEKRDADGNVFEVLEKADDQSPVQVKLRKPGQPQESYFPGDNHAPDSD